MIIVNIDENVDMRKRKKGYPRKKNKCPKIDRYKIWCRQKKWMRALCTQKSYDNIDGPTTLFLLPPSIISSLLFLLRFF